MSTQILFYSLTSDTYRAEVVECKGFVDIVNNGLYCDHLKVKLCLGYLVCVFEYESYFAVHSLS